MEFKEGRVWPAMFTPLDDDGAPRLDVIDRLVEVFAEQQLGGLYVLGSTGQGILLSVDERRQVAEQGHAHNPWCSRTRPGYQCYDLGCSSYIHCPTFNHSARTQDIAPGVDGANDHRGVRNQPGSFGS